MWGIYCLHGQADFDPFLGICDHQICDCGNFLVLQTSDRQTDRLTHIIIVVIIIHVLICRRIHVLCMHAVLILSVCGS